MSAIDDKMSRKIEQWEKCCPETMAKYQSTEAMRIAFSDMKHDILLLYKAAEALREDRDRLQAIISGEFPEGCTPADARVLREANHGMIDENARLRARAASLKAICRQYANISYNLDQLGRLPNESEVRMLKDLQVEFDKLEGE